MTPPPASSPAPRPTVDRTLVVETPEQVAVGYELAGPGSRFVAFGLDVLVLLTTLLALFLGLVFALFGSIGGAVSGLPQLGVWVYAGYVVLNFLLIWGYFVGFEAFRNGQTPGKRWMGLRVIQRSGFPLGLPGAVIRNLVRILDVQPGITGMVGGIFILLHPRAQRPGDLAAGTVVIRERPVAGLAELGGGAGAPDPAGDEADPGRLGTPRLPDPAWEVLRDWAGQRLTLERSARRRMAERLHAGLGSRVPGILPEIQTRGRKAAAAREAALLALYADEGDRRAGVVALPGMGPAGTASAAALLRRQRTRWAQWEGLLGKARRRGLPTLNEGEVAAFASLYREVSADLARARTYQAAPGLLAALEASVGRGYNLLYTAPRRAPKALLRALTHGYPRLVRRLWIPVGLATLLFYGPAAVTWTALVQNPDAVPDVVPTVLLERAQSAESERAQGIGYGEAVIADAERPLAAAAILTNNVRVTFMAFVGGMLAGLGTVIVLVVNGVMLGGAGAAFQLEGQSMHLWSFVLPHGVLELSAICLSGAAGLWMGSAVLLPGRQTRGEALATRALDAVHLLGGVVVILVVAGIIEGFISPSPNLSEGSKVVFGLLTSVFLVPWLLLGGRDTGHGSEAGDPSEDATAPSPATAPVFGPRQRRSDPVGPGQSRPRRLTSA